MKPKFIFSIITMLIIASAVPVRAERQLRYDPSWGADSLFQSSGSNERWWQGFDDATLDSLIALGTQNNWNLTAMARNIEVARQQKREAQSAYYPQIGLSAGYNRSRTDAVTTSYFNAGASLNWEIDVFGKITRQVRKSGEYVKLSAIEYDAAILALQAQIADTYITLMVEKMQLGVANAHSKSQARIVQIAEDRHRTGLASKLDVAQARTMYYSTIATIPKLEASIQASYNALSVLTATPVEELPQGVFDRVRIPDHYQVAALGTPAELLQRRPDIAEAQKQIDIAASELGISRSQWLPSLGVTASAGTMAHKIGDMFTGSSFTYSVAPTLSWALFDGLSRSAANAAARESLQASVDNYNNVVLTAMEEVRNAIAAYSSSLVYIDRLQEVLDNCEEELRLSVDLYKQGLTQFSNVADAQMNYLTYQNTLVAAKGETIEDLITLYKALGGGF